MELMKMKKNGLVRLLLLFLLFSCGSGLVTVSSAVGPTLDPLTIPKYVTQLVIPPVFVPDEVTDPDTSEVISHSYSIDMTQFQQQILPPPFNATTVWGYGGDARDAVTGEPLGYVRHSPGATFDAVRGIPVDVEWVNMITGTHMFAVDPTIHWADPNNMGMPMLPYPPFPPGFPDAQTNIPLVTHLHGGEVQSTSDGGPDAWFTASGTHGPSYYTTAPTTPDATVYNYPNGQPPTTLWYHDHALGMTRLNVMSGLAGFYLLSDPSDAVAPLLPTGKYEIPLAIQDRSFNSDGSLWFPAEGINPDIHPYWFPEFFGNTIMVNGVVWPNLDVDQGQYRFRILDGSNARFYTLSLSNGMPFTMIGSDGGYLQAPATLTSLTIAPGERADILVDFSGLANGTKITLINTAPTPYPDGVPADPATTGQIMQFTVTAAPGEAPATLPTTLNPTLPPAAAFPTLHPTVPRRILVLKELMGALGPLAVLLNGQPYDAPVTELPRLGTTEDWVIVNLTMDTHPIHLHLIQFQLVSRQTLNAAAYDAAWQALNGAPPYATQPTTLNVATYLTGPPQPPPPAERGWKDTVQMNPGEVTTIRVRFAPLDDSGSYPFDATVGPGYVWHCHILDHEDNEMMRPYRVVSPYPVVGGLIYENQLSAQAAEQTPTPAPIPEAATLAIALNALALLRRR